VSFFPCDGDEQLWTTARRPSSSIPATSSELLTETYLNSIPTRSYGLLVSVHPHAYAPVSGTEAHDLFIQGLLEAGCRELQPRRIRSRYVNQCTSL
jgi:hypothetical protein